MAVKLQIEENCVIAYISGELDHHHAKGIRQEIDIAINQRPPDELVLDFSGVSFMDSAGIGLVMGRYKIMQGHNGKVIIQNPPEYIAKVIRIAGIRKIAEVKYTKEVIKDEY